MGRLQSIHKFYKRYEVDLWGKVGFKHNYKIKKFLYKIHKEKESSIFFLKRKLTKNKKFNKYDKKLLYKDSFKKKYYLKNNTQSLKNAYIEDNRKVKRRYIPFVYRIDTKEPRRKRKKTSLARELFIINRKLRSFYGNIKRLQLRRYARYKTYHLNLKLVNSKSMSYVLNFKNKNIFKKVMAVNSFLSIIEHRLDILLYRSNFAITVYHARFLIKHKKVYVNQKLVTHCNYQVKNFELVKLDKNIEILMFNYLKKQIKKKKILNYPPIYISVNYSFMVSFINKNPIYKNIPFPFSIDLKKWLGLAKMNI